MLVNPDAEKKRRRGHGAVDSRDPVNYWQIVDGRVGHDALCSSERVDAIQRIGVAIVDV